MICAFRALDLIITDTAYEFNYSPNYEIRMKKNQISLSFSYIAQQAFNLKTVNDHEVLNLFHMPIVPYNPGIGVFFTRFNKKLNMVISNFDSKFNLKEGENLKMNILNGILNP